MGADDWSPSTFQRFERSLSTSTRVAKIVTDAGDAYLKGLGNPEGPHALVCEWVGTQLARLFGLPTFDHMILRVDATEDEIPLHGGGKVESGSAFCSRAEPGHPWGGDAEELMSLDNPHDITRLVVFDTWVRNRDRHYPDHQVRRPNRDNVFFSSRETSAGRYRLLATDHTHCFADGGSLTTRLTNIGTVRDPKVYGLFPEFGAHIKLAHLKECLADLQAIKRERLREVVQSIPPEWEIDGVVRDALMTFLADRAQFVAKTLEDSLRKPDGSWPYS